ncbi:MAG: hypothetical protein L0Y54_06195 [Sporichthyaceae bacterium]|nr:hypothetical protein [Sporichthyaceae bacterium]
MRSRRFVTPALVLVALVAAGCGNGSTAGSAPPTSTAVANAGGSAGAGGEPATGGGENGFEGSFTTSGPYAATWTASPEAQADPFNAAGAVTLASDKRTFGNVSVQADGSISFGSAAPEFGGNSTFTGTGAQVTMDSTGAFVCAFTIEADLTGANDGTVVHLSGGMTAHWHPEGVGGLNCP